MEGTHVCTLDEIGALCGSEAEMCHLHNPPCTLGFELLSLDPAMPHKTDGKNTVVDTFRNGGLEDWQVYKAHNIQDRTQRSILPFLKYVLSKTQRCTQRWVNKKAPSFLSRNLTSKRKTEKQNVQLHSSAVAMSWEWQECGRVGDRKLSMKKGKKPSLMDEQELPLVSRVKRAVFQLKVVFFFFFF